MAPAKKTKSTPARKKAKPADTAPAEAVAAVVDNEPAETAAPRVLTLAERAVERRRELTELKAEIAKTKEGDPVTRWLTASQENDVRNFVASKSKQMDQRRYQLSLVKTFIDDPSRFGLDPGDIPTSTSLQEYAERRSELEYRIGLMKAFLEILNDELKVLNQAEASAQASANGGGATNSDAPKAEPNGHDS